MKKILLHICCGICASSVVERLRQEGFCVFGFFYNPNIHPEEEYQRRLAVATQVSHLIGFELIEGCYDKDGWFKLVDGLENEPEGGKRCLACFKMRLQETQKKANQMNISKFTTTLTVSPHKNAAIINEIGKTLDPAGFLEHDFKKKDGFRLTTKFARAHNLYRQNYCGCIYSRSQNENSISCTRVKYRE